MIINRGNVRVRARAVKKPMQLCAPNLKLLGEEKGVCNIVMSRAGKSMAS